jgi:hypothetical protein
MKWKLLFVGILSIGGATFDIKEKYTITNDYER